MTDPGPPGASGPPSPPPVGLTPAPGLAPVPPGPGPAPWSAPPGYPQPGPAQPGSAPPGYPQPGSAPPGYQQLGYPPAGCPPGSAPPAYAPPGYAPPAYAPPAYGQPGYGQPPGPWGYPPPGPGGYWQPYAPPRSSGLNPIAKVAIGCGAVLAAGVIALIAVGIWLITHGPLRDFPAYPGASQTSDNVRSSNGKTSEERIWKAPAARAAVAAWYREHLTGQFVTDQALGDLITFHSTSGTIGDGIIQLSDSGGGSTTVDVTFGER